MGGFDSLIGPAGNFAGWKGRKREIRDAIADAVVLGDYLGGIYTAISEVVDSKSPISDEESRGPLSEDVLDALKNSFSDIFRGSRDSNLRGKYTSLLDVLNSCVEVNKLVHISQYRHAMVLLEDYRETAEACLSLEAGGNGRSKEISGSDFGRKEEREGREREMPEEDPRR
jgi:hypothetical protein